MINNTGLLTSVAIFLLSLCTGKEHQNSECPVVPALHLVSATRIWNFLRVNDELRKSDVIIGLGSHDRRVAVEAARLWLAGWADLLVFSGHSGNLTIGKWRKSEAEIFQDVAISLGVPKEKILIEPRSRNTGENIRFSYTLLRQRFKIPNKIILVQKPHMGKRTVATFMKQWPGLDSLSRDDFIVRTPDILLSRYPNDDVGDLSDVISVMMGYLQRLDLYYELGYQTYQEVPSVVWKAFRVLKESGKYDRHLVNQKFG